MTWAPRQQRARGDTGTALGKSGCFGVRADRGMERTPCIQGWGGGDTASKTLTEAMLGMARCHLGAAGVGVGPWWPAGGWALGSRTRGGSVGTGHCPSLTPALPCLCPRSLLLLESKTEIKAVNQQSSAYWPLSRTSPLISSLIRLSSKTWVSLRLGFTCLRVLLTVSPWWLRCDKADFVLPVARAASRSALSKPWRARPWGGGRFCRQGKLRHEGTTCRRPCREVRHPSEGAAMLLLLHLTPASVPGSVPEQPVPRAGEKTGLRHPLLAPRARLAAIPSSESGFHSMPGRRGKN